MRMIKGDAKLIKELNLATVLDLVRVEGPISRTDIAKCTKLSHPAVSTIIGHLLEEGLIQEGGKAQSQGGRPARLLHFNPRAGFVIGVDVGGTKISGAIVDLDGHILTRHTINTHGADNSLASLMALIKHLLGQLAKPASCWGIGLGVPGAVDPGTGSIQFSPGVGWDDIDIAAQLEEEFSLPVWVDNDVNGFVRGEHRYGSLQGVRNGIGVAIGTGIGVGMLLNNQMYQGQNGAAGEVGYWILRDTDGIRRSKGYGPLEAYAAGPGIAKRAKMALEERVHDGRILLDLVDGDKEKITAKTVFEAARLGDPLAQENLRETTQTLGVMMGNLASLLNVERIVVGGGVSRAGEDLIGGMREIVEKMAPYPPEIVVSALQEDAGILGAVAGVLESNKLSLRLSDMQ